MVRVASPDGQVEFRVFITKPPDSLFLRIAYQVSYRGKLLIDTSLMGFVIHDQEPLLGENIGLSASKTESVDETYTDPADQRKTIRNHYNGLIAQYLQNGSLGRRTTVEARAYDDGVAFRYYIPRTNPIEDLRIDEELTDFKFAQEGEVYPLILSGYQAAHTGEYRRTALSGISKDSLIAVPFLAEQPGVGWVAITEADIDNYPVLDLFHPEGRTMRSTIAPRVDDPALAVHGVTPAETPWRVFMIGSEPGKLIGSNILENLNPPSAIPDTSWIKPVKEYKSMRYSADLDEHLDDQFARLQKAGVAGVKLDLMNRGDQQAMAFYRRAAKVAAEHHLVVEFENAPPPDGIERTWPNVVPRQDTLFTRLLHSF